MDTSLDDGIGTPEEQRFAGRIAGAMYVCGSVTALGLQLLPGVPQHWLPLSAIALAALLWGVACLLWIDWPAAGRAWFVVPGAVALVMVGVCISLTGGAESPVRFFVILTVTYFAAFYRPLDALALTLLALAVTASPVLYDAASVDGPYVGELVVLEVACFILAVVVARGKQLLVALREQAQDLALRDPLTDLPNRRAMMLWLESHTGGREAPAIGIVLLDLDGFKAVNTIHGYRAGDDVLRALGTALSAVVREDVLLARLGGDEFAALLPDADAGATRTLAERLVGAAHRIDEHVGLEGTPLTASGGRVLFAPGADTVEGALELADRCLRVAKALGKDRVVEPADLARAFAQLEATTATRTPPGTAAA